jgi:hypothetical protein
MNERCRECGPGYRLGGEGCRHGRPMTPDNLRDVLAEVLHDRIDGDFLLGGGGWGPDGWVDDIPLHGARISDVVRWATNALAIIGDRLIAEAVADARADEILGKADSLTGQLIAAKARDEGRAEQAAADRARIEAVLDEYERMCDPAPYTSERALYERLRAALDSEGGA